MYIFNLYTRVTERKFLEDTVYYLNHHHTKKLFFVTKSCRYIEFNHMLKKIFLKKIKKRSIFVIYNQFFSK